MRKPLNQPQAVKAFARRSGPAGLDYRRVSAANSNTRIFVGSGGRQATQVPATDPGTDPQEQSVGLNTERLRAGMVQRLSNQGITDERVLAAMARVPRHRFVDQGLASRAYTDDALPIGYNQTISQPWIVARMVSVVCENRTLGRVLEIGAGCGYQAAVLSCLAAQVYGIERIRGLQEQAVNTLSQLDLPGKIQLVFSDGLTGLPENAPFDAILVAAAGPELPVALFQQLAIGGRLVAPCGSDIQHLVLVERTGKDAWRQETLEAVRFVPLRSGIQF